MEVSIVGKREVGRELVWCRVAIQTERVVLGFSFVPRNHIWKLTGYLAGSHLVTGPESGYC